MASDPIVSFYSGGLDDRGRRLDEILGWSDERLESVHDYIQWVFPTTTASGVNPHAPLVTSATVVEFAAPDMRDHSFRLRGAAGPSEQELTEFELSAVRVLDVTLPLELELSRDRPEVSLQFRLDPELWLAEVDAGALVDLDGDGAGALLDAFAAGLSVRVE